MKTYPIGKPKKMKSGKYQWYQRYRDPLTGKIKRVTCLLPRGSQQARKEAELILAQKLADISDARTETDITIGELSKLFLDHERERGVKPTTLNSRRTGLVAMLRYFGEDAIAKNITKPMVTKYLQSCLKTKKNSTVNVYRAEMSLMYEFAINYGYLTENPAKWLKIQWKPKDHTDVSTKLLSDEELDKLFSTITQEDYLKFFQFMYLTGMRFGEVAALQFKNIHLPYVDVTGTLWHGGIKSNSPKTFASYRTIFLPKQAVDIIKWFDRDADPDDFVFINQRTHGPFAIDAAELYLGRMSKEAGLSRKVTTHMFRHTHISKLAEQGVPLHVIQKRVGHTKSATTREIYLHVTKKMQADMESKINDFKI